MQRVDLSSIYEDKKHKSEEFRGIINIFKRYKFTIEENTPIEEEIALDPELLGKVFENLLASYNPETHTTARKATGSFYTPREIVDYMVDESLVAYLETQLKNQVPEFKDVNDLGGLIRETLSYTEKAHPFTKENEVEALINAIDNCKILDPACGSGAFPMGILHKLVYLLHKLDPQNEKWMQRQIERVQSSIREAEKVEDTAIRERLIQDLEKNIASIEDAFLNNELDYGRKLYLIENCIYGVDIQPIAIQIAKLRFFISLVIDQKIDPNKPNLNIRALPNLETKFLAANTLIGLNKSAQGSLGDDRIHDLENKLIQIRQKHFSAKNRREKKDLREKDEILRHQLSIELQNGGWPKTDSDLIANWNPYDQNASATFFDPEWMFGIEDGFDIVIGNPPYGADLSDEEKKYLNKRFEQRKSTVKNSAIYFTYVADCVLKKQGVNSFIVPKSLCYSTGWSKCAELIILGLSKLIDMGKAFENVLLEQVVFVRVLGSIRRGFINGLFDGQAVKEFQFVEKTIFDRYHVLLAGQTYEEIKIISRMLKKHMNTWGEYISIERGLNWQNKVSKTPGQTPIFRGAQLDKYILTMPTDFTNISKFARSEYAYQLKPKVLNQLAIAHVMNPYPHFFLQAALDEIGEILVYETISCTFLKNRKINLKFILGLNNSKFFAWLLYKFVYSNAIRSTRYDGEYVSKIPTPNLQEIEQATIVKLVDRVLIAKRQNPQADTSELEREIDRLVYALYGLTEEEIAVVEGKNV